MLYEAFLGDFAPLPDRVENMRRIEALANVPNLARLACVLSTLA